MQPDTTTQATGPVPTAQPSKRTYHTYAREVLDHGRGRHMLVWHGGRLCPITGAERIGDLLYLYAGDPVLGKGLLADDLQPHTVNALDKLPVVVVTPDELTYDVTGRRYRDDQYTLTTRGEPYCPADRL